MSYQRAKDESPERRRAKELAVFESGLLDVAAPKSDDTIAMLGRYRRGDKEAGDEFVRRYQEPLLRYVEMHLGEPLRASVESSDVVQDALVNALPRLGTFEYRGKGSLLAYLKTTAHNIIRNLARRPSPPGKHLDVDSDSSGVGIEQAREDSPSVAFARRELAGILTDAADRLPEKEREVIHLSHYLGGTWAEVAEQMGYADPHTAEQFFQRAKERWFEKARPRLRGWREPQ